MISSFGSRFPSTVAEPDEECDLYLPCVTKVRVNLSLRAQIHEGETPALGIKARRVLIQMLAEHCNTSTVCITVKLPKPSHAAASEAE